MMHIHLSAHVLCGTILQALILILIQDIQIYLSQIDAAISVQGMQTSQEISIHAWLKFNSKSIINYDLNYT